MDFTITKYTMLLKSFCNRGYSFQTFAEYLNNPLEKVIILRHDVDKIPKNSLRFGKIQYDMSIKTSYYFRIGPISFDKNIILKLSEMGHEIGYHYETLDFCRGNIEHAYIEFCDNLEKFRQIVPIETICMHGSPLSLFDNRDIWKHFDYRNNAIIGEPYFDIDFNKVFYITDTGRRFDGDKVSIRDKASGFNTTKWPVYHSTRDIIRALNEGSFPDIVMMTFHPQRWTNNLFFWLKELIFQSLKNFVKSFIVRRNENNLKI